MHRILFATLLLLLASSLSAEIKLPAIVGSNMVLQREASVNVWGWADAGEVISIDASWLDSPLSVTAGKNGKWKTSLITTGSKAPQSIHLKSSASDIRLENILFGEVWLCSGQSNMQQPVKGFPGQPTMGGMMAAVKGRNPNLRLFTVERNATKNPLEDVDRHTAWAEAGPESILNFSAIAYFFGQQLQEVLDVPVGLIHSSWGGSDVRAWMSDPTLATIEEVVIDETKFEESPQRTPTVLFNAMIAPLTPYTIKGALWYQGESNRKEPQKYSALFPAMVKDWRARWGQGDFPFYYVQIAPFGYGDDTAFSTADNSSFIREAQLNCLELIPNSGMAVTMDVGDLSSIHPPRKQEVADRLLLNALHNTYGFKAVDPSGPLFEAVEENKDGLLLNFRFAEEGLYAFGELTGFEIAGEDRIFYPASARIVNRRKLLVSSPDVPTPVAVRYGWDNYFEATLFDANLLPASSFRTDDWTTAERAKQD